MFGGMQSPFTVEKANSYMWDFIEDFITTDYKDSDHTTVYDWENESGSISLPQTFPKLGSTGVGTIPSSITVKFPYVYVTSQSNGLQIFEINNPSNPQDVGEYPMNTCIDAVVDGNYLYVANYDFIDMENFPSYFTIFNITSNPANPIQLGSFGRPSNTTHFFLISGISISNNWAYIVEHNWALETFSVESYSVTSINITNPLSPILGSSITIPLNITDYFVPAIFFKMFLYENHLYLPNANDGFHIIDVTDPLNIDLVFTNNEGYELLSVSVDQDMAYFLDVENKIQVFDVTIPTNPNYVTTYTTPQKTKAIFVEDRWVYLAHSRTGFPGGFQAIDFQNPLNPIVIDSFSVGTEFHCMTKDQDYIYLVGSTLEILGTNAYVSTAVAQSKTIVSTQGSAFFQYVDFSVSIIDIPANTAIEFYFSSDAGLHWELASMATGHEFIIQGTELRWKAILTSTDGEATPSISYLMISSYITIATPSLLSPEDGYSTFDNTPTLTWEDLPDAYHYYIQLDQVSTFNSPNLDYYIVNSAEHTITTDLSPGKWYWRVAAMDMMDELGEFSSIRSITIDNVSHPEDFEYLFGTFGHIITWNAQTMYADGFTVLRDGVSVTSGIWEGDPVIISVDGLPAGLHNFTCTFYDLFGNTVVDIVTVSVSDIPDLTNPSINHPEDIMYIHGSLGHTLSWEVADIYPASFKVERNNSMIVGGSWFGDNIQITVDGLPIGSHLYTCTVYDQAENTNYDTVMVTVYLPIEEPQLDHPDDISYEEGTSGHILTWNPVDTDPDSFKITRNGIFLLGGPWRGEAIVISVDGLTLGTYEYTFTVYDEQGNEASDILTIMVVDTTPPSIDHPKDVTYIEGISDNSITWYPADKHPASFSISLNGTTIDDGTWNGNSINVDITGLSPGNYTLICTAFDTSGNSNYDLVEVFIPLVTSRSSSYSPFLLPLVSICMVYVVRKMKR